MKLNRKLLEDEIKLLKLEALLHIADKDVKEKTAVRFLRLIFTDEYLKHFKQDKKIEAFYIKRFKTFQREKNYIKREFEKEIIYMQLAV